MITARYFDEKEFNRCTPSCSLQDMNQEFMKLLDKIRDTAGIPLVLTCAYRPHAWEIQRGRSGSSSHTLGQAVDIKATNSRTRYLIIDAALKCGISRIGIHFKSGFIHLDNSTLHDQQVIWDYA